MDWRAPRYTRWAASHPVKYGLAVFAVGLALLAAENVALGANWSEWAVTTLILWGLLTVSIVWRARGVYRARS